MRFLLVGFDVADKTRVCYIFQAIFRDLVSVNEEYGVGAIDSAIGESLSKPSEFVGRRFVPDCAVFWASGELSVIEILARVVVTNELYAFTLLTLSGKCVGSAW